MILLHLPSISAYKTGAFILFFAAEGKEELTSFKEAVTLFKHFIQFHNLPLTFENQRQMFFLS